MRVSRFSTRLNEKRLGAGSFSGARDLSSTDQQSPTQPGSAFQRTDYAYAAPTMIFLIRMYGEPCEMLLVCVG